MAEHNGDLPFNPVQGGSAPDGAQARPPGHGDGKGEKKKRDRIKGVFSTQSVQKVGTGTTVRKTIQKTFWMVDELESGAIQIQPLNVNYVPSGPKRKIAKEDLLEKFSPEPEFYVSNVFPAIKDLEKTVDKGDEHRKKGELFSAEHEFQRALAVDVDNVRANFGLGLTYLERGEAKKADNIFERLVKLEAAFEPEHKHLFNDFGINLRKNKMYDQALIYYQRALELSQADENLHYNIARCYFEQDQTGKAVEHLKKALQMNPELEAAKAFLQWLAEQGHVDKAEVPAEAAQSQTEEPAGTEEGELSLAPEEDEDEDSGDQDA
jgi:tetratricopeptide (TPR) repeat protein